MSDASFQYADTDFEDYDDDETVEALSPSRVLTRSLDEPIGSTVQRIMAGRLILQPEFQRRYVWNKAKASALIESILLGIPLPTFYMAELPSGKWEAVDGQQRLTAISSFISGKLPTGESFRLRSLRVRRDLKGASFASLSEVDQETIQNYPLRIILLPKEADPELKYEVFERLNSGSQILNDMELRNCLYRGAYNDMLRDLAANKHLLLVRGEKEMDDKMRDRQWILRFFAMTRQTHTMYRLPMKAFLNTEMRNHRNASPEEISRLKEIFEEAIEAAYYIFGSHAFRRYSFGSSSNPNGSWPTSGPVNLALWDTILYSFARYRKRQLIEAADAIREEFLDLLAHDDTFIDYIGRTTDKTDRIQYRADVWLKRLSAVVNVPANEPRTFTRAHKIRLFDQDSSCSLCGQAIMDVNDAEVDHVKHFWRGGRTIPENSRLTHRYCNRSRGGRVEPA